ncbi:MAG: PD-(D/E)XK nuclease family protein [Clostridia bacterium]|nr:PD-(D/E)XK nuclease family protein [Clostridia bacterium]
MLHLIKGRAGCGKTKMLHNKLCEKSNPDNKPLLIVPEQFSFETDRSFLKTYGAKKFKNVEFLSFKRLAFHSLKGTPGFDKNFANDGVRGVLMSEAIDSLAGRINVFNSRKYGITALSPLVDFCRELKYCCISGDELQEKTQLLEDGFLKEKLQDIFLINEAYDALVKQSYFDDTDAVSLLCDVAREKGIFKNRSVFFDGFRAFSRQQAECFSIILSQAQDVYVSLCLDENSGKNTPFYFIKEFENQIRTIANECSCVVDETYCFSDENKFSSDILQLEKYIFTDKKPSPSETNGSVKIARCVDVDDECRFVACEIKKLLRSGEYRCKDIAVIERSSGKYKDTLVQELKALDIPVFEDSRRSLKYEALFVYLNSALACISTGLKTENILMYLKSGLSGLSIEEISLLEKYALVWNIGGAAWRDGFTMHPDGFGKAIDERAQKKLEVINDARKRVVAPLLKLKKDCEDKTGDEITRLVFEFLDNHHIQEKLYDLHVELKESGFPVEAHRQEASWDMLVSLLDEMAVLGNGKYMTLSRWYELFSILTDSGEIGEIPQGLDEIRIGSADRIRTEQIKVAFLVGVNKDEFPLVSVKEGVLTDSDRVRLTQLGLLVRPPYKDGVGEEQFIAYCALTSATEKLYLSYRSVDADGAEVYPSEIIDSAKALIADIEEVSTAEMDPFEAIESDEQAFSLLARNFRFNNSIRSTLLEYFSHKPEFEGRINSLQSVCGDRAYRISDIDKSEQLFGKDMFLSASRIEAYYNCPFSYFLRYGMRAEPLRVAELDPAQGGTIIHLVMEHILQKYPRGDFLSTDSVTLKCDVEAVLTDYIENKMGGKENKSSRFIFLFNHLVETCMAVIERLKNEFSVGSFEPCGFEVSIGDEVPSYEIPLERGRVCVKGSIDRVDMMEKDGIRYLRVVDYKTGKKEFKLCELFDGLNIQMVLYLMSLEKNGKDIYGDIVPAGVLYLPSRIGISDYLKKRSPEAEEISKQKTVSGKLSGMLLESLVVLNGMGAIDSPLYFPASFDSVKDKFTGNTFSQAQFKLLSKMIDGKIKNMGDSLHRGEIPAIPCGTDNKGKMCKYCSYVSVCGYEAGDPIIEMSDFSHNKALEMLGGEGDE